MIIYVFGNPDLRIDSLPLRILPKLKKELPEAEFKIRDPNEEWDDIQSEFIAIDTAVNVRQPCVVDDLRLFNEPPRSSLHDFDALMNLKLLHKLGRLKKIKLICLPPDIPEKEALMFTVREIRKIMTSSST